MMHFPLYSRAASSRPRRRHHLFIAATAVMLVMSGAVAVAADPHADAAQSPAYSALDDAHLQHVFHELMDRVDAGQKEQMRQVGKAAVTDLALLESRARIEREPRAGILLADTLDRAALERVRVAEMAVAEERSRRVDRLLVDLATVMTAKQRAQFSADISADLQQKTR